MTVVSRPSRSHKAWCPKVQRILLAAAVPVALVGCGGQKAAPAPELTLRPCTIGDAPVRCGTLKVAENPSKPNGTQIGLRVAVFKATSPKPKPDPLFWFAGWGSGGVTDDAANVISAFAQINGDRDVVFIDQRGTGSSKVVCRLPSAPQLVARAFGRVTQAARECAERVGPNLRYYTSSVAVDDFDQVRRALGYEKINIYGGSYGVTTGQIYLLRHGAHVRTAVFDSGSLLDVHIFERQPPNIQRALKLLFTCCEADIACHAAYPHLRREYEQIVARVARSPIAVPGTKLRLDLAALGSTLDSFLAYTPGKAVVPRVIHLVATGQLARAVADFPQDAQPNTQLAYQLLITCSEPWASWRPAEIDRLATGTDFKPLYRLMTRSMGAVCAVFPKAEVPPEIGQRVHSTVPVLFLSGNEDGADPPANIANARRELPNSRTVVFAGAGHGQLGLRCAQDIMAQFVVRGTAASLDASCADYAALQVFDTRR